MWNPPRITNIPEQPWKNPVRPAPRREVYPSTFGTGGCPKCGGWTVSTTYLPNSDRLRKVCRNCGYLWDELPKDRQR